MTDASSQNLDGRFDPRHRALCQRIEFTSRWRAWTDNTFGRVGLARSSLSEKVFAAGNVAFDVLNGCAHLRRPRRPGRAYLDVMDNDGVFPQGKSQRGYWFDAERNALVGMQLGLDMNWIDGKYYLIENNVTPAFRSVRRELYPEAVDPVFEKLVDLAERRGFKNITLYSRKWDDLRLADIARAAQGRNIEMEAVQMPGKEERIPALRQVVRMPDPLPRDSLHVLFSGLWPAPLVHMLHDKGCVQGWYDRLVKTGDYPMLVTLPWSNDVFVPPAQADCWPNLVIKLAELDKGLAVVMGRFETEEQVKEAIGYRVGQTPDVFAKYAARHLFKQPHQVLYQEFAPGDVVDGRLRIMRIHGFFSPLEDFMLSAHGIVGGEPIEEKLDIGLLKAHDAYVVKRKTSHRFELLGDAREAEIGQVTQEFGSLLRRAIEEKFKTRPASRTSERP